MNDLRKRNKINNIIMFNNNQKSIIHFNSIMKSFKKHCIKYIKCNKI